MWNLHLKQESMTLIPIKCGRIWVLSWYISVLRIKMDWFKVKYYFDWNFLWSAHKKNINIINETISNS